MCDVRCHFPEPFPLLSVQRAREVSLLLIPTDRRPPDRQRGIWRERVSPLTGVVAAREMTDAERLAIALLRGRAVHGRLAEDDCALSFALDTNRR